MSTLPRGTFVKIVLGAGAGLTLGAKSDIAESAVPKSNPFPTWVRIEPDDRIIVTINKVEMGQGVATGLPTILADELDASIARVEVEFAPDDPRYYDPSFKMEFTGGSMSIETMWMPLRTA
ncbi:MAG: molybdopterin-dependent oxidoreductase, partial [Candidatus Eremiobacteraeota bacterium]|nr:molybdopterin-dependent oxidoreductase [Candidatus Eremiobacteraeota bacterium]